MAAYEYVGTEDKPYPWGAVRPGAVAIFHTRPPDADWREIIEPATSVDMLPLRPNKAASAEDWKAYAIADGAFQDATGTHPDDATRRAIVEHYTGSSGGEDE